MQITVDGEALPPHALQPRAVELIEDVANRAGISCAEAVATILNVVAESRVRFSANGTSQNSLN